MSQKKRFKAKKSKKNKLFKIRYLFYVLLIYLGCNLTFNYLKEKKLILSNENFINFLLSDTNHVLKKEYNSSKIVNNMFKLFSNIDITNPVSALDNKIASSNIKIDNSNEEEDNYENINELERVSKYIEDPKPEEKSDEPLVYIYNSHQLENYSTNNTEIYNIKPNVMMTSYMLREKLNDYEIPSLVEEANINELLRVNGWSGSSAYKASKLLIEDAKEKNKSLKYFIDVHRDSVKRSATTIEINGVTYAKLYFVIGLENPDYKYNMEFATKLDKMLNDSYKGISKGILAKEGKGVNGVYNQNLDKNLLLIEFGGVENTIDEVNNTVEVFAKILSEYIKQNEA